MESTANPSVWDLTLIVLILSVGAYGLGLVFAGEFIGDQVFDRLGFGPTDGEITRQVPLEYVRFIYAVLGAVIGGWMTTIAAIAMGPLRRREIWSWWALAAALSVWFVLDTGMSMIFGFVGHAWFNVAFALALAVPLVMIRRDLQSQAANTT